MNLVIACVASRRCSVFRAFARRRVRGGIAIAAASMLASVSCVACTSSAPKSSPSRGTQGESTPSNPTTTTASAAVAKFDLTTTSGYKFEVTTAPLTFTPQYQDQSAPPGQTFIVVSFVLKNLQADRSAPLPDNVGKVIEKSSAPGVPRGADDSGNCTVTDVVGVRTADVPQGYCLVGWAQADPYQGGDLAAGEERSEVKALLTGAGASASDFALMPNLNGEPFSGDLGPSIPLR